MHIDVALVCFFCLEDRHKSRENSHIIYLAGIVIPEVGFTCFKWIYLYTKTKHKPIYHERISKSMIKSMFYPNYTFRAW